MSRETILIVEDQRGFRRVYQDALEGGGYWVLTAEDGEKGLDQTRFHRPALVLLDLGLPRLNGFEVLQKIRQDASLDGVKVVIFSVMGEEKDVERAMAMGANGYVLKGGHTPKRVIELIREMLDKPPVQPAEVIELKATKD
ncbi:MAG TPA: response regulator [bacterium]|nr:response regulator [bacterium]